MHFISLEGENLLPYKKFSLDLKNRGLVLIQGQIEGSAALSSNGAGKSSLIDCLLLALFGRTLHGRKGRSVTHFQGGDGLASLAGTTEAGRPFLLDRFFASSVNARTRMEFGDTPAVIGDEAVRQSLRSEILGPISFSTFLASSIFSELGLFSSLEDAAKKLIFEELLSLEEIPAALARTKAANQALVESKMKLERQQLTDDGESKALEQFIQTEAKRVAQFESIWASRIEQLRQRRVELEARAEAATSDLYRAAEKEKVARETEAGLVASLVELRGILASMKKEHAALLETFHAIEAERKTATKQAHKAERLAAECSECEQQVPVEKKQFLVKHYNTEAVRLENAAQKAKAQVDKSELALRAQEQRIADTEDRRADEAGKVLIFRQEQKDAERRKSEAHQGMEAIALECVQANSDTALIESKKSLQKAEEGLRALKVAKMNREFDLEDIADQLKRHSFWLSGYGPQGLKSWLIEEALPYVNTQAKMYSELLADGELLAQISATSTTQAGDLREKMQVTVRTPFTTQDYWDCSSGMRCRADIAITLAIGDYASSRCPYPIRLAMLDELFDPLDETGVERAMGLLKGLTRQRESIFVISHSPIVQQHFSSKEIVNFSADGVASLASNR